MDRPFYITTPIYYVNDMPHIGHIYTTVMADVLARYHRLRGRDARLLTGSDEHGQKIERSAKAQGITPIELADRVVARYHHLWQALGIAHDDFIRTTEPRHQAAVSEIIRRIKANGHLYKGEYTGWYCAGAEAFVPESQVVDGKDSETGYPVEQLSEPSWFFRLSAFQEPLLAWYRERPECIRPQSRYNEVVRFVEGGLKDLSISRASLSWGVPFPGDPEHVVYVWLDALTNYISALGFGSSDQSLYDTYWPASIHLVGKDILRFHCVYWPAFLMAAGLPVPEQVFGHGWWLRDEAKMSKSVGNVVRPDALLDKFGADALRYFLAREMAFGQDASFSDQSFLERFNADLANTLGNTASRTLAMTGRFLDGKVPTATAGGPIEDAAATAVERYLAAMERLEPHRALEAVWQLLAVINATIQERQPWTLAKQGAAGRAALEETLYASLEGLRIASLLIEPFMPPTAAELRRQLALGDVAVALVQATAWGGLAAGTAIGETRPLFPRVDLTETLEESTVSEITPAPGPAPTGEPAAAANVVNLVSIDDFAKIELKVGVVVAAERVPKSKKLIRLQVDLGEGAPRQVVAGIAGRYEAEPLVGRRIVVVANLQPATLMGYESRGMLLAASLDGEPSILSPDGEVPPGTKVR